MKKHLWLAVVLLAGVAALATAQDKKSTDGAAATVADNMKRLLAAWSTLDPDKAEPFYAKDPDLVFYDIAPVKYTGWAEYEAGTKAVFADFSALQMTILSQSVHPMGNGVWANAEVRVEVTMKADGMKVPLEGRWTSVWEKRGKDWLIVHEHVSVPFMPPTVPAQPAK